MKTMKKSKFLLVAALSLIMALSMIGALTANRKKALAADGEYTITAESGAQLRLNQDGGMRFRFSVDGATRDYVIANENVKIQFIIAPQSYFTAGVAEKGGLKAFVTDEENNIYQSTTDGKYYVNGCIQRVNVKNVALDFTCQARIVEVGEDGQTVTKVIASADSDARNLYDVINKTVLLEGSSSEISILDSAKTPYSAWFGTAQYPVRVETQEEYEILKNKCNAEDNTVFANVAVAVSNKVTTSDSDFTVEANKPAVAQMHTVTFMNGEVVYATVKVKHGQTAVEPAINPRKPSDGTYIYAFGGWEGDLTAVTEDRTITALFASEYVIDHEVALWEADGATNLGSALTSNDVVEQLNSRNVYKVAGGYGTNIANNTIDVFAYKKLYLAYKTTADITLSHGTSGTNPNKADTWYFVEYTKQADNSWKIGAKKFGDSSYDELVANPEYFSAEKASLTAMFRTYRWSETMPKYDVYATDVWGVADIDGVIDEWRSAGATNLGSALNADASDSTLGNYNIYKTTSTGTGTIARNIKATDYKALYVMYKTSLKVSLTHSNNGNSGNPYVWYVVKYERQSDNSWRQYRKTLNGDYVELKAQEGQAWLAASASFGDMFRTWGWGMTYDVYATDVWGVNILDEQVGSWEAEGAKSLGSALKSSDGVDMFGNQVVYKVSSGGTDNIANEAIVASKYKKLYLAYKTTASVSLTHSGDGNKNVANVWYLIKYEKQADNSWKQYQYLHSDNIWQEIEPQLNSEGKIAHLYAGAPFTTIFKTYVWGVGYDVYATNVWGVYDYDSVIGAWENNGATSLGSSLNSSDAVGKLGSYNVYKTTGAYGVDIANAALNDVIKEKNELYFAYKTSREVSLSHSGGGNVGKQDVWYFVRIVKQEDGSRAIYRRAENSDSEETLIADPQYFSADATFTQMFKTWLWKDVAADRAHDIYATDVWAK